MPSASSSSSSIRSDSIGDAAASEQRVIFHVDMDSFYASCELKERPELKDKPFIVGADPKGGQGRGVVISCNYAARKLGIHSALPISLAWKICPGAVYVRPNFDLYLQVSARVTEVMRRFADALEKMSIDEAYLDVTRAMTELVSRKVGRPASAWSDEEVVSGHALAVKRAVLAAEGISCSVGVANSKLVAKIATDMKKPDGLTIVKPEKVREFLTPLEVGKIPGVGKVTQRALKEHFSVRTIGDLAAADPERLREHFGKWSSWLRDAALGADRSEVVERWEPRSISSETTFEQDEANYSEVAKVMREVALEVFERVTKEGYDYTNVAIKIRFEGFETHTKQKTLTTRTSSLEVLVRECEKLLSEFSSSGRKVRLIGVRVSGLEKSGREQASLLQWGG